jgi:hypothetical protein
MLPYLALLGQRRIVVVAFVQKTRSQAPRAHRLESQAILHSLQYGPAARTLIVVGDDEPQRKALGTTVNTWRGAELFTNLVSVQNTTTTMVRWKPEVAHSHFEPIDDAAGWAGVKAFLDGL